MTTALRNALLTAFDSFVGASGILTSFERRMRRGITILMYHRVLPDEQAAQYPLPSLAMPRTAFDAQVRWLAGCCRLLTVKEALASRTDSERQEDKPIVCITFDDGYHDNFEIAGPILSKYKVRATFFVTSGFVANHTAMWFDRAALAWLQDDGVTCCKLYGNNFRRMPQTLGQWLVALESLTHHHRAQLLTRFPSVTKLNSSVRFDAMKPEQVCSLAALGHEIGAHTVTHPKLSSMPLSEAVQEVIQSKSDLERMIGQPVVGFAYPHGICPGELRQELKARGFQYACAMREGRNPRGQHQLQLRRLDLKPRYVMRKGVFEESAFRGEISLLHPLLRAVLRRVL